MLNDFDLVNSLTEYRKKGQIAQSHWESRRDIEGQAEKNGKKEQENKR